MQSDVITNHARRGLLALCAAFLLLSGPAFSAGPPPLRVIVKLDTQMVPESILSPAAGRSQRARVLGVQRSLERRMQGSGARVLKRFGSLPLVVLEVPHDALERLATSADVALIEGDRLHEMSLNQSAPQIEATDVHTLGYDGTGWHIAVLDTGVDVNHPAFAGRVDDEACFSFWEEDCPGGTPAAFGSGAAAPCGLGGCFHGTHVAGIALGDDSTYRGVAPGAHLIAIQVFSTIAGGPPGPCPTQADCVLAYTSDIISGLDHVYQLRNTYQIAAVNLSLGGGQYFSESACDAQNPAMLAAIGQLRSAGIATVAASGNDGFGDALGSPACLSEAVSVGSVTKQGAVSSFSNSASFLDLLAPGDSIASAVPGQGFGVASGTSMATPHAAGAWALCTQRNGSTPVDDVLQDLQTTGVMVLDPLNEFEHPLLQLEVNFVPEPGGAALALATLSALAIASRRAHGV